MPIFTVKELIQELSSFADDSLDREVFAKLICYRK
jgi:hypothetical protein